MLQAAERRGETINYTAWVGELHNEETAWNEEMSQRPHKHTEGYATWDKTTQVSWKVTVKVTVHDLTTKKWPNGAGE